MVRAVPNTDWVWSRVMPPLAALLACVCVMVLGAGSAVAQQAREPMATTEPEPLVQGPARRARPRINVRPRYPYRSFHTIYPPPYDVEFPGPNAKRECTSRLVTEHRPSGTVVVPRMHCWWVGG